MPSICCHALTEVVLIDTPGHDSYLMRLAHSLADTLITPLNDSFVDLDVLGTVDPRTFRGHRDQPLFSDGAGGEAPAPPRSGIYRELYPRGLTAVDDVTLGVRPTMSHVTARLEMQNLLGAILLGGLRSSAATTGHNRAMG